MARTNDPQAPRPRHLRLLPHDPPVAARPLPAVVPLLQPDQPVTPAQEALLTSLARQARLGDRQARDLLWSAFAPRLEPALRRSGRIAWLPGWARRDDLPWELDDLRQEAWLVFSELAAGWDGEGSFVPYVTAYFPWRLRCAMRRLGPTRRSVPLFVAAGIAVECDGLFEAEGEALLAPIAAALSPADAIVLQCRVTEDMSLGEIARELGVSRRTVIRRWTRVRRITRRFLRNRSGWTKKGP
jgi:RNA polymerase sigma factor (sigma-70 family)